MKAQHVFTHVEEDGFSFVRDGKEYLIFGTAEATYNYSFTPGRQYMSNGDPGYPDETDLSEEDFDCWLDYVTDSEGDKVEIKITDEEWASFEAHMSKEVAKLANEYSDWGTEEER